MGYFIPLPAGIRDVLKQPSVDRYLKVTIDPAGQPTVIYPVDLSCVAAGEYQKWTVSLKNRGAYEEGMFASLPAQVAFSVDDITYYRIWTGFVSDDGCKRDMGLLTDDTVSFSLVDPTGRKGTKRTPSDTLLVNCTVSDLEHSESSILHILASMMGVTDLDTVSIPYTLPVVELGSKTIWKELQLLAGAYHADCYYDYLGRLRFRSPLEEGYTESENEWTFQGDPSIPVEGNASRIIGRVETTYLPVRCNRATSTIEVYEELSLRVIYKNTDNYNEELDQCLIEIQPGESWPGPSSTDKAQLSYKDPGTGEAYDYASSVQVPTLSNGDTSADIVYEGGVLTLFSCNGSNEYTAAQPGCCEIILRNSGNSVCRIRKLTIRGIPYRQTKEQEIEFTDADIIDETDYVEEDIDGKYAADPTQIYETLGRVVSGGKDQTRQFSFAVPFLPQIQRKVRVAVQLPGKALVPCFIETYSHTKKGKSLAGMQTQVVCTEIGEFIPSGTPKVVTKDAPAGVDTARSLYTWIVYGDDLQGGGLSFLPEGKRYIGIAQNKTSITPSEDPTDYTWAQYGGDPGTPGVNGESLYTWVKYADDISGNGMSDSPIGKGFIGFGYNKSVTTPSTEKADYSWSPFYLYIVANDLQVTGQIRSGYDANGNAPTSGNGFFLGSSGELKAKNAELKNALITGKLEGTEGRIGCLESYYVDVTFPRTLGGEGDDVVAYFLGKFGIGEGFGCDIDFEGDNYVYGEIYSSILRLYKRDGGYYYIDDDTTYYRWYELDINWLAKDITTRTDIKPVRNGTCHLGSDDLKFKSVYANQAYFDSYGGGTIYGSVTIDRNTRAKVASGLTGTWRVHQAYNVNNNTDMWGTHGYQSGGDLYIHNTAGSTISFDWWAIRVS